MTDERDLIPLVKINPNNINIYIKNYIDSYLNSFYDTFLINPYLTSDWANFLFLLQQGSDLNLWTPTTEGGGAVTFNTNGFHELRCSTPNNGDSAIATQMLKPMGYTLAGSDYTINWNYEVLMWWHGHFFVNASSNATRVGLVWSADGTPNTSCMAASAKGYGIAYRRDIPDYVFSIYNTELTWYSEPTIAGDNPNRWLIFHVPGLGGFCYIWNRTNQAFRLIMSETTPSKIPSGETALGFGMRAYNNVGAKATSIYTTQMGLVCPVNH